MSLSYVCVYNIKRVRLSSKYDYQFNILHFEVRTLIQSPLEYQHITT